MARLTTDESDATIHPWAVSRELAKGDPTVANATITLLRSHIMNLKISGHHLEITPAIHAYVTGKLERVTRHFDNVIDVNV